VSLPPLTLDLTSQGPTSVITIHGVVDISTANALGRVLDFTVHDDDVLLDAAELSFMDSAGINVLVRAIHDRRRGSLSLCNAPPQLRRLLAVSPVRGLTVSAASEAPAVGSSR
jgi:anti-anti-sigma factor